MYKNIKKITMLLFVAATMFTFASCNKDDDNNGGSGSGSSSSIDESKLIGTWHFENADYRHCDITFNADHTCDVREYHYSYTLSGNKLHGAYTYYSDDYEREITEYIDLTIKSLTDDTMVMDGKRTMVDGSQGDYSGTLHKVQ